MCWEYDEAYLQARIEEARKAAQKAADELKKPKPTAPAAAPEPRVKDDELVPV